MKSDKASRSETPETSETTLEMMLDAIPHPIFYKDRMGRYLNVNKSFEDLFKLPRNQLLGKNVFDIFPREFAEVWFARDNELLEKGTSLQHETKIKNADGEFRNFIVNTATVKDYLGNTTGLIGILQDITELDQANEAQHRLNRELVAMSSCRQAMIRATDEETLINDICRIVCDEAGYRMAYVGYVEHDEARSIRPIAWQGENAGYMEQARLSWSEETERGRGQAGEAVRSGNSVYVEDIATDPRMAPWREAALQNGYRSSICAPFKDESGEVIGLLTVYSHQKSAFTKEALRLIEGLANDLSFGISVLRTRAVRIQTEAALRESEEKYRGLFNNSPLGVFRSSIEGRYIDVNPALASMLGYDSPESLIREIDDIGEQLYTNPENRRRVVSEQLKASDDVLHYLNHYRRKDGSECIANLYLKTVRDKDGRPLYFDGITEDITRYKQDEKERKNLQNQLIQAQKMESIGQLAGGVAHDFNNLLSIIIGYGEILAQDLPADSKSREAVTQITDAAVRAKNLTRQLLAFSRKQKLEIRVVNVNRVIADFKKLLQRTISEDVVLRVVLTPEKTFVKADVSQLEQILMNLVVNARDAMPDGGALTIETACVDLDSFHGLQMSGVVPGRYVLISVSDNGIGMDRETTAKIFEPFFTTKPKEKGTGLGLSTVYGVVKQHGGNIWVHSEPGHGTTFKIYLPVSREMHTERPAKASTKKLPEETITILVVEDEALLRKLACDILERDGYQVLEAASPQDAMAIGADRTAPIHLLLTDVVMPDMKGTHVYQEIVKTHPEMKVLYMSGYSEGIITRQGIFKEKVNFIQKPFSLNSLTEKIQQVIDV